MAEFKKLQPGQTVYYKQTAEGRDPRKNDPSGRVQYIPVRILGKDEKERTVTASIGGGPAQAYRIFRSARWFWRDELPEEEQNNLLLKKQKNDNDTSPATSNKPPQA